MWFNSKQREEPYLGLTCWCKPVETSAPLRSASTGAAWLSSARVVRCWVKSRNERNPRSQLPAVRPGTLGGLPALSRRKVGTTSSHHGPYVQGDTRATMPGTARRQPARGSQSLKAGLSSDCSLQLDCMKPESLVIADQPRRGEYVPGPCTHRPSRHGSWRDRSEEHTSELQSPCNLVCRLLLEKKQHVIKPGGVVPVCMWDLDGMELLDAVNPTQRPLDPCRATNEQLQLSPSHDALERLSGEGAT